MGCFMVCAYICVVSYKISTLYTLHKIRNFLYNMISLL